MSASARPQPEVGGLPPDLELAGDALRAGWAPHCAGFGPGGGKSEGVMERAGGGPGGGKNEGVVSMTAAALRMGKKRVGLGVFGTAPLTIGLVALAALGEVGAALISLGTDAIALAP